MAVGDGTILLNPGRVTGDVPIVRYDMKPQAMGEDGRVTIKYPSGSITGSIPIDPKEMLVFHNVV